MTRTPPPEECANCGAAIPRKARACPGCGADERTGWREDSIYDGLDLPDEADDEPPQKPVRRGVAWYWIAVGLALAALLVLGALGIR
ncbi:MAG: hypothetical protein RL324_1701 [Verrucomicrobiota bacterium]|jgi:hypothetical protein